MSLSMTDVQNFVCIAYSKHVSDMEIIYFKSLFIKLRKKTF